MNKVEKVKYIMKLEEQKEQLERNLAIINGKIDTERAEWSHVSVDLGYYGLYPSTGDEYCCLLCGKGKNRDYYYNFGNTFIMHYTYQMIFDILFFYIHLKNKYKQILHIQMFMPYYSTY